MFIVKNPINHCNFFELLDFVDFFVKASSVFVILVFFKHEVFNLVV